MVPETYASLTRMIDRQLSVFPEHRRFLESRFSGVDERHLRFTDELGAMIEKVAGPKIDTICEDYRWLSQVVLGEEVQFRRSGRYRYSTFEEAEKMVYSNFELMSRYMNGLLASQLWWRNHTEVLSFYRNVFIPGNASEFHHLEVGPGHGLFLYLAAISPNCRSAEGWDISEASIAGTKAALAALGAPDRIALRLVDLFAAPSGRYDSITFSEVLEHLEDPAHALKVLYGLLAPGGRIFINAPANSPAPDHIYLFRSPEEVEQMVVDAGFTVVDRMFAPCTGYTLERARKAGLAISAAVIAAKP